MNTGDIAEIIIERAKARDRFLVAITGPPGSGKSTSADALRALLVERGLKAKVVPMDGFHLDNTILDKLGLRHRKGAPDTFDAEGFVELVGALRHTDQPERIPGFDREQDRVVEDQYIVEPEDQIILIEGNYLLLRSEPWNRLLEHFDLTIFLNPGIEILERRLIQRWLDHDHTHEEAVQRARSNDIPNAEYVLENSARADIDIS